MKWNFILDNWSLSTLARGLKKPRIIYANHETSIDDIKEALEKKINGPGSKTENRVFHLHARRGFYHNKPQENLIAIILSYLYRHIVKSISLGFEKGVIFQILYIFLIQLYLMAICNDLFCSDLSKNWHVDSTFLSVSFNFIFLNS